MKSFGAIYKEYKQEHNRDNDIKEVREDFNRFLSMLSIDPDNLKEVNGHFGFDSSGEVIVKDFICFYKSELRYKKIRSGDFPPDFKFFYKGMIEAVCANMESLQFDEEEIDQQYVQFWTKICDYSIEHALFYLDELNLLTQYLDVRYQKKFSPMEFEDLIFFNRKIHIEIQPILEKWKSRTNKMFFKRRKSYQPEVDTFLRLKYEFISKGDENFMEEKENYGKENTISYQNNIYKENKLDEKALYFYYNLVLQHQFFGNGLMHESLWPDKHLLEVAKSSIYIKMLNLELGLCTQTDDIINNGIKWPKRVHGKKIYKSPKGVCIVSLKTHSMLFRQMLKIKKILGLDGKTSYSTSSVLKQTILSENRLRKKKNNIFKKNDNMKKI